MYFVREEFQGTQPKVKELPFFPDHVTSFITQREAQKFFDELNTIFHVRFRMTFPGQSIYRSGDWMSPISSDLPLPHL